MAEVWGFTFTRSFDGEGFAPMAGKIWVGDI